MKKVAICKKGLGIWKNLIANNDTTGMIFTLFLAGFSGTVLIISMLSLVPNSILTALGIQFLIIGSLTALTFLILMTLRIIIEWFAYLRYK